MIEVRESSRILIDEENSIGNKIDINVPNSRVKME